MDNASVVAGHGRAISKRLLVKLSVIAVSLSLAFAVITALFQREAEAQFNFFSFLCPILISLANAFSGFFGGIFNALLAAFGCAISG